MKDRLTNAESLEIISNMINQAKQQIGGSSFQFLMWGWVVLTAYLGHFTLAKIDFNAPYVVWLITIPAAIVSFVYGYRQEKDAKVKTYTSYIYGNTWLAMSIPLVAFIAFGSKVGSHNLTGLILLISGSATFVSGKALKFLPTIYGSFIIWLGGIFALIFNDDNQFLIGALAVTLGYLVPGYLLKMKEKNG
ncbi:MAG: hypothetical protein KI790_03035 [Cyclobacteriaceae bacterium]|nr:hypothetical protein [Cyclobacteriaceae bacterium HetDA_MAG_MS6]